METIKVKRNPPQNIIHPIPPHNGFGSEEDSLLNVKYLDPNGKIHEYYSDKFKRDKHILRFNAKLISPVPSDEERTFIISFFLTAPQQTDFIDSCKRRKTFALNESNGFRSCTMFNLGIVAERLGRGFRFDPVALRAVDDPAADRFLYQSMRAPWKKEMWG